MAIEVKDQMVCAVQLWVLLGKLILGLQVHLTCYSDLADTFPQGEFAQYFRTQWVLDFIKDTRQNPHYDPRTHDTARWAKEQVRRQTALNNFSSTPMS
jgi:hypothetical protein